MTALAAGGSVLLLSFTAVLLWPRTYGTEATFVLNGGPRVDNPVALAGRIEAALLEREQLAAAAMELPPELRSPDPIGRLRAGIRVQARGAIGYAVEFRGSDPQSVQRIANRLAERAVILVPKLAASPDDAASLKELAERSRAVSEFLTAHPEVTVDQPSDKQASNPSADSGLELLRTEKRQLEQRLAQRLGPGAADNPYAEPGDDQNLLNLRLIELKTTIAKREAALKQPRPAVKAEATPELASKWRALLADLAMAQAKAAAPAAQPPVSARVTARAPLPTSPLTPNRLVLSLVAVLLSLAAALVAYILPRRVSSRATRRDGQALPSNPPPARPSRSDAPPAPAPGQHPRSDPPPGGSTLLMRQPSEPPRALGAGSPSGSEPPPPGGSEPPPPGRGEPPPVRAGSEPPGPMAPHRPVVLTSSASGRPEPAKRVNTPPGGLEAPRVERPPGGAPARPPAATHSQPPPAATHSRPPPAATHSRPPPAATHSRPPPAAPLFGSRPPPGAGSYSVSSSHPPPFESGAGNARTAVERLKPLQSAHPPAQLAAAEQYSAGPSAAPQAPAASADGAPPTIMSRPPALDPEAERWAAHFEAPPPVEEAPAQPRKRAARWKTQAMGSMVPLEVSVMRAERPPPSEVPVSVAPPQAAPDPDRRVVPVAQPVQQAPLEVIEHDVPLGWSPKIDANDATVVSLRDAVLAQGLSPNLRIAVTGSAGNGKAELAAALAFALAETGRRVLLIEADFDHPQVHQALAIEAPSGAGFSQQIMARRGVQRPRPWVVVRCSQNLQVLAEGRLRSPGLLASEDFERALQELGAAHQMIVIHAPALGSDSDLGPIDMVSQVAVIARSRQPVRIQFGDNPIRAAM